MTLLEYFNSLTIPNWIVHSTNQKKGTGQAEIIQVRNADRQLGIFRKLKSTKDIDIRRFKRELKILTDLHYKSPYIVEILDYAKIDDQYWYISRKGNQFETFWQSVKDQSRNADEVVINAIGIIKDLCKGLAPLHEAGVVHRDLKPDNLIEIDGSPVIIDFGVAFHPADERVTPIDQAVGNVRFSPDQMANRMDNVPPWLDVTMLSQLFIWMVSE